MAKINVGDEMLLEGHRHPRRRQDGNVTVEIGGMITIHHTLRADSSTILQHHPEAQMDMAPKPRDNGAMRPGLGQKKRQRPAS